jgi:hypothetical protein
MQVAVSRQWISCSSLTATAMQRHLWVRLIGILLTAGLWSYCCSPTCAQLASPPLTTADQALVHRCEAMYGTMSGTEEDIPRVKNRMQAAKQFFDAMPRSEIERRLVPIRKSLYRGTHAYTSVAFVLAYYGIDFDLNAQRVVEAIHLLGKPPAKLRAVQRKAEGDSGAEEVADAVERLYKRRHSASLLVSYLRAPADGILAEDQAITISSLFLAYPTDVLWAARKDLGRLSESLVYDRGGWTYDTKHGDASLVRRTLHTLEHSRDADTAAQAKDLRRRFERGLRKERLDERRSRHQAPVFVSVLSSQNSSI